MTSAFTIFPVTSPEDLTATIKLFEAYAESLGIDLTFQDFATEMASMPGKYASPTGTLLLARNNGSGEAIGCVGLRPLVDPLGRHGICEMKRLYVDPEGRGTGAGKALAERVVAEAKSLGYEALRLDTLPHMESARGLYRRMGFVEIGAYYETPLEGTIFLELKLK